MVKEDRKKVIDKPTQEDNKKKFEEILKLNYKLFEILGYGTFGDVYRAEDLYHKRIVALKLTDFRNFSKSQINIISSEPNLIKLINCPYIIRLYDVSEINGVFAQALEQCIGGNLHSYIKKNPISESDARNIMTQILKGIQYLHNDMNIIHRDLKPLNILLKNHGISDSIRIADFGLAGYIPKWGYNPKLEGAMGTHLYMAPELVLNKGHDKKVDIWACGLILYNLLFQGKNPFYEKGESKSEISENIVNKEIDFKQLKSSIEAKDLLKRMLEKDSGKRYLAGDALNHPWITGKSISERALTADELMSMFQCRIDIKLAQRVIKFMVFIRKYNDFLTLSNRIKKQKAKLPDLPPNYERNLEEMNKDLFKGVNTKFLNRSTTTNSKSAQNIKSKFLGTVGGQANHEVLRRSATKLTTKNLEPYVLKDKFGHSRKIDLMHDSKDGLFIPLDEDTPNIHINVPGELPASNIKLFFNRSNVSNQQNFMHKSRSGKKLGQTDVFSNKPPVAPKLREEDKSKAVQRSNTITDSKPNSKGSFPGKIDPEVCSVLSNTSLKQNSERQKYLQTPENKFRVLVRKPSRSQNEIVNKINSQKKSSVSSRNSERHIRLIQGDIEKISNNVVFAKSSISKPEAEYGSNLNQPQPPKAIRPVQGIKFRNLAPLGGAESNLRLSKSSKNIDSIHNPNRCIYDDFNIPLEESHHEEMIQQYFDHKNQISNKGNTPKRNTFFQRNITKKDSTVGLSPFSNKTFKGSKSCKNMTTNFRKSLPTFEDFAHNTICGDALIKNQQNTGNRNLFQKVTKSIYNSENVQAIEKANIFDRIFDQINYHHNIALLYQSLAKWLSNNTPEVFTAFILNKRALQKFAAIKYFLKNKKYPGIGTDFRIKCLPKHWKDFCQSDIKNNLVDIIDDNCSQCSEVFNRSMICAKNKFGSLKNNNQINTDLNENIHKTVSTVVLVGIKYLYSAWELSDQTKENYIIVCLYLCLLFTFDEKPDNFLLAEKMKDFILELRGLSIIEKMCYLKDFLIGKDDDLVQRISYKYAL